MDTINYIRYIAGVLIIIGLFILLIWILKKVSTSYFVSKVRFGGGYKRRLGICETIPLDIKRRLLLVRVDQVEYVVIIGGEGQAIVRHSDYQTPPVSVSELAERSGEKTL